MLSFLLPNRQVTPESTLHTETTPSVPRVESTSNNGIPTRSEHLFENQTQNTHGQVGIYYIQD